MKIQTFSIVAGSEACNASCPFCISKMTVPNGIPKGRAPEVNWRNFHKACRLAQMCGVTTAMITGKGEPSLFPAQVTEYLEHMEDHDFPIIEMQSNGIPFMKNPDMYDDYLDLWHKKGLTTVAVSIVHHDAEANRRIYLPGSAEYIDLPALTAKLHARGLSVRWACVMIKDHMDVPSRVAALVNAARDNKVEQLTLRPVNKPGEQRNHDDPTWNWTAENHVTPQQVDRVREWLDLGGDKIMTLTHGATVYDVGGQNVCLTDCLSIKPGGEDIRQLIYFPDGRVRYDWQYEGAILF